MAAAVQVVGTVVGGMIGGPVGAQIGGLIGGVLGNAMFPPPAQEGPKLSDLKLTTSSYGVTLPKVYGTARMSGNLVWASDLVEHKHSSSVGKGGGQEVNTYSYSVSVFIALCEGEITGLRKIWANSILVWDSTSNSASAIVASTKFSAAIRVYLGTEDQEPDPFMQAADGADTTPAYRGTAGVFMQDLDLSPWNGAFPNFEFEVTAHGSAVGPRLLNSALYKIEQAVSDDGTFLYHMNTSTDYFGGYSIGPVIIANVSSNAMDIVCQQMSGGPYPSYPVNRFRWTIDEVGNFLASGSSVNDYSYIINSYGSYSTPPWFLPSFGGNYTSQWVGKAGQLHMYLNRGAPLKIGGTTIADAGVYPSMYDPLVVGGGTPNDPTGFYLQLCNMATGWIHGVFPSADGSVCVVTTGPNGDGSGDSDHWHKFTFAGQSCHYESSGAIEAGNFIFGFGRQNGNYGHNGSGMVESNGINLWTAKRTPPLSKVSCYEIGGDGVMRLSAQLDFPPAITNSNDYFSVYADGGVCFVSARRGFASFTRQPSVDKDSVDLAYILTDICKRSGLTEDQIDVSTIDQTVDGVVFGNSMSYRSMIETLLTAYFVDAVESDGKLKFVKRGGAVVATIPEEDLAARDGMSLDAPPDQIKITRQQELELPREVTVDYFALGADLQDGSQTDSIQSRSSLNVLKMPLPLALSDNDAANIARKLLYQLWAGRETYQFATNLKYSHIEPTDIVTVYKDGHPLTMRITKRTDDANGVISWEGVSENPTVYEQSALGGIVKGGAQTLALPGPTDLLVLDAPALTDNYGVVPLVYLAGNGFDTTWNGASLLQSFDGGDTYQDTGVSFSAPCIIGRTASVLPPPAMFGVWDNINTVDVFLSNGASELTSDTEMNVLAGFNTAYIGGEIVGYKVATQTGLRQYRLSGLLRGEKGTEDFAKTHVIGEDFVVLNSKNMRVENIDSSLIGSDINFKAVTFHGAASDARTNQKKFTGRNLRPFSPVQVLATKSSSSVNGDWVFQWNRRARTGGAWRDGVDVPFTDPIGFLVTGEFEVEIMSYPNTWPNPVNSYVIRTITGLGPNDIAAKYTVAQQIADFGAPTNNVIIRVYQVSATVGRSPLVDTLRFVYMPTVFDGGPAVIVTPGGPAPDLWLKFAGPNGGTTFTDSSVNNLPVTAHGTAAISTAQFKFRGSSGYFDGSGYIDTPAVASIDPSGLNFNFIVPILRTSSSGTQCIVGSWGGNGGYSYLIQLTSTAIIFNYSTNGFVGGIVVLSFPLPYNASSFDTIEFDCLAGSLMCFVNGKQTGSTYTISSMFTPNQPMNIARNQDGNQQYLYGYVGDFRFFKQSRHRANHYPAEDVFLNCTASSATDGSFNESTVTLSGSTIVRTGHSAYRPGTIYSPGGSSDFVRLAHHQGQWLADQDFTLRVRFRATSLSNAESYVFCKINNLGDNNNRSYGLAIAPSLISFYYQTAGGADVKSMVTSGFSLSTGTTYEIEIERYSNNLYFKVDGAVVGSNAFTDTIKNGTSDIALAAFGFYLANTLNFNGDIEEFTINSGMAVNKGAPYTPIAGPFTYD